MLDVLVRVRHVGDLHVRRVPHQGNCPIGHSGDAQVLWRRRGLRKCSTRVAKRDKRKQEGDDALGVEQRQPDRERREDLREGVALRDALPGIAVFARVQPAHPAAADETDLEVLKEETALDLTAEQPEDDKGKEESTLTAELIDPDSAAAIADRTIEFFAGDELIGTATTDQNGVASFEVPPRYKDEDELEARFSVDEFYLTSSDTV